MNTEVIRSVLLAAAELIERQGWSDRLDLASAIYKASPEPEIHVQTVAAMHAFLGSPLWRWNDAPGRVASDVVCALREAAS